MNNHNNNMPHGHINSSNSMAIPNNQSISNPNMTPQSGNNQDANSNNSFYQYPG